MTAQRHLRAVTVLAAAALAASACASSPREIRVLPPRPSTGPEAAALADPASPAAAPAAAAESGAAGLSVARTAETLLGLPYREGGARPDGFDCSGLVSYVFARHGVAVPRDVRRQAFAGTAVSRDDLAPGDLVFFSTAGSGPTHVGIAIGGDRFIHAPRTGEVVRIESLSAGYWTSRFAAARRIPIL